MSLWDNMFGSNDDAADSVAYAIQADKHRRDAEASRRGHEEWLERNIGIPSHRPPIVFKPLKQEGRLYRRQHWPGNHETHNLAFTWDNHKKSFAYVRLNEATGQARHEGGHPSKAVLKAMDIEEIHLPVYAEVSLKYGSCDSKVNKKKAKDRQMTKRNVDYIGAGYMVVTVTYELNTSDPLIQEYSFKTTLNLVEGDMVAVESSSGYGLCRVTKASVHKSLDKAIVDRFNQAKAWVIDKIDMLQHEKRREATERKKFIMKELEERKAAVEEKAIYKMLAETDPEAAKLLVELEKMDDISDVEVK